MYSIKVSAIGATDVSNAKTPTSTDSYWCLCLNLCDQLCDIRSSVTNDGLTLVFNLSSGERLSQPDLRG